MAKGIRLWNKALGIVRSRVVGLCRACSVWACGLRLARGCCSLGALLDLRLEAIWR